MICETKHKLSQLFLVFKHTPALFQIAEQTGQIYVAYLARDLE